MKIAITGSTGFIGSHLVKYFSNKGWDIIAFLRKKENSFLKKYKNIEYISWDINNKFKNKNILKEVDVFIHCAANLDYEKTKEVLLNDNVTSLKNIYFLTKNIKHFIYISSSSVYQGLSGILKTNEKIYEKNLINSYSLTKFLAEKFILKKFNKNNITIIRPRAVYGKGDRVLVPNILKNQIFGRLILPGDGNTKTSITEINDLVKKIYYITINKHIGIYNISTSIDTYKNIYTKIVIDYNLSGIIKIPMIFFKILSLFNKNKYSYIVDTFGNNKILDSFNKTNIGK